MDRIVTIPQVSLPFGMEVNPRQGHREGRTNLVTLHLVAVDDHIQV